MKYEKKLTPEQLEDCKRLKALFDSKKKELKLTQQFLADELDISQGAVGHYVNGRNSLNVKVVCVFSKLLRVDPKDISPSIAEEIKEISELIKDQGCNKKNNKFYQLDSIQEEILELIKNLPKNEVDRILLELRAKKTHYDTIFEELLIIKNKKNAS
ncbi:MAG: helix-turn-helix domain-containing protein [Candidatus Arsenophonus phytopathogenicus]